MPIVKLTRDEQARLGRMLNSAPPTAGEGPRIVGRPAIVFAVKVWRDGGTTDGDLTNPCNRTYLARTIDATSTTTGIQLGTGLTPEKTNRLPMKSVGCMMLCALPSPVEPVVNACACEPTSPTATS